MAGRKRRKPDGVAGFLAGAVSDRQKTQAQTQRLEARAQLAWAKENAKTAAANAREKARQEQREAREREIAEGHAEAEAVTRTLQGHLTELRTLLTGTLDEDPYCRGTALGSLAGRRVQAETYRLSVCGSRLQDRHLRHRSPDNRRPAYSRRTIPLLIYALARYNEPFLGHPKES